jgi:hypothetical protein
MLVADAKVNDHDDEAFLLYMSKYPAGTSLKTVIHLN